MAEVKIAKPATLNVIAERVKLDPRYQEISKEMPDLKANMENNPKVNSHADKYFNAKNEISEIIKKQAELVDVKDVDSQVAVSLMLEFNMTAQKSTELLKHLDDGKDLKIFLDGMQKKLEGKDKEPEKNEDKKDLSAVCPSSDLARVSSGRNFG